jgi:hypothetical protein
VEVIFEDPGVKELISKLYQKGILSIYCEALSPAILKFFMSSTVSFLLFGGWINVVLNLIEVFLFSGYVDFTFPWPLGTVLSVTVYKLGIHAIYLFLDV